MLLFLIPLVNLVFACILLFKEGDPTENKYGLVPKGVKNEWIPIAVAVLLPLIAIGFLINLLVMGPPPAMMSQLTKQIMSADAGQISAYKNQTGDFPANLYVLVASSSEGTFFSPVDAWGHGLFYTTSSKGTFTLQSAGPDGDLNTTDDIVQTYPPDDNTFTNKVLQGAGVVMNQPPQEYSDAFAGTIINK